MPKKKKDDNDIKIAIDRVMKIDQSQREESIEEEVEKAAPAHHIETPNPAAPVTIEPAAPYRAFYEMKITYIPEPSIPNIALYHSEDKEALVEDHEQPGSPLEEAERSFEQGKVLPDKISGQETLQGGEMRKLLTKKGHEP
ncbi:MAG TPA: hypothetical protein VFF28_02680 [Candidatus Nanoarchaeia archaeon]|nr:hypothetical protein [Candidatus Nanoarchaeia archaeon]